MRDIYLGLNQKNVLILKNKYVDGKGESLIKTEDLILIRRIQDFIASSKTVQVVIDGNIFSWVHYEVIQEDLPMIFPSVVSVKKRIEKLKKLGLIVNKAYAVTKQMVLSKNDDSFDKAGKFSVIRLSKECRTMFDFSNMESLVSTIEKDTFNHEGVKGKHHEGVKGKHHEGVIKEYHEKNTIKKIPSTCNDKLDFFEILFKEKLNINFTTTNQKAVIKLLKTMNEKEVEKFLIDNFKMAVSNKEKDPNMKSINGIFVNYLKKGERIPEYISKEVESKKQIIKNEIVKNDTIEKDIILNDELEQKAIQILIEKEGLNINYINDTKRKSIFRYETMLKQVLKEVV